MRYWGGLKLKRESEIYILKQIFVTHKSPENLGYNNFTSPQHDLVVSFNQTNFVLLTVNA